MELLFFATSTSYVFAAWNNVCLLEIETILDLHILSSNLGLDCQRYLKMQKGTEDIQCSICAWFPLKPMELFVDQSTNIRVKNISNRSVTQGGIIT